ncbi:MAG: hypothetical protein IJA11_08825 [Oscillospiraceae bacterium]|nr:hypothetical protein [Oscillospiraceae bacterium]
MIEKDKDKLFDRESAQGSAYDKLYFTDEQLKQGTAINQKAASGEISWDSAHNWWENTRAGYGYSGGEDGHGYTALGDFSSDNILPYEDKYSAQTDDLLGKIMNREPFSYDPANDPLYQQYADSYTRMGKQAMEDTLAQISARTGGLASSYAGTASQQTYDGYMAALADKVPELRQLAYQMYMDEGNTMRQDLNLLQQLEAIAYDRYRDQVGDAQWQQNYNRGVFEADRNFNYGVRRDEVADERWQTEYDDRRTDAAKSDAQARISAYLAAYGSVAELDPKLVSASGYTQAELAALEKYYADLRAQEQAADVKPGGGGGWDNGRYDEANISKLQAWLGMSATEQDGRYGKKSAEAAKAKGYNSLEEAMAAYQQAIAPSADTALNGLYQRIVGYIESGSKTTAEIATMIEKSALSDKQQDELLTMLGY